MKKLLIWVPVVLVVVVGGGLGYMILKKPAMAPARDIKVSMAPERIARGKHIFETIGACGDCHSPRDFTKYAALPRRDQTGAGFVFPEELGFPGKVVGPNITPDAETGIGRWTDGEKLRALREGVDKDGRALFPLMPYQAFAHMSDEDAESVVAYLNTLRPIRRVVPQTKLDFPVNVLIKSAPKPVPAPVPPPDRSNILKYGEYLVRIGGCINCHTPENRGELVAGKEFSGGREFRVGNLLVRSANITPDPETGIGKWSEARFLAKFQGFAEMTYENAPTMTQASFTLMPWPGFARLSEGDLKAIYGYLRTLKPIYNSVEIHPAQVASN
jgi:mono/diheme cytochrome c family protein